MARGMEVSFSWSVDPPLGSRLKYLNNYWMDWLILCIHGPERMKPTRHHEVDITVLSEMTQHLHLSQSTTIPMYSL